MGSKRKDFFVIPPDDVTIIPLQEVLDIVQDLIPERSRIDLSVLAAGLITDQDTNCKRHRFQFKVIRDLYSLRDATEGSDYLAVQLGKALLRNTYDGDVKLQIDETFKSALESPDKYMMVTLFGECLAKKDDTICIAALLGIWTDKGLYITYLSVSDQIFSRVKFGPRADSKSFLHRGIARLTVAIAQAFLQCIHRTDDIYLFSSHLDVEKGCLWDKLGFQRVVNVRIWPEDIIQLIDLYSFTKFQDLWGNEKLVPYFIRGPVKEYAVSGYLIDTIYDGNECIFFRPPFYHWPTLTEDSLNDCTDMQLAAYCMRDTPGAKKVEETILPQRNLAKILLDILRHTKVKIMEQKKYFEQHNELRSLLTEGCILPSIAIDYANMALMLSNVYIYTNTFTISTDTVRRLCEDGWDSAYRDFKDEFPEMKSEFDLIKDQCDSKKARFIFPFLRDSKLWYNIVRIWLEKCIIFLFCDCSDETKDDYELDDEEDEDKEDILRSVMWPFMNSPLWPIGVKAYWIRVPNVQQVEEESGARCFLHGYIMAKLPGYAAFHLALLKLHDLDEEYDLNIICRNWVHDIMLRKKFFVPGVIEKIMEEKEDPFPYGVKWFEENCIPRVVNSVREYLNLEDEIRDAERHRKSMEKKIHDKGERVRAKRAIERGECVVASQTQHVPTSLLPTSHPAANLVMQTPDLNNVTNGSTSGEGNSSTPTAVRALPIADLNSTNNVDIGTFETLGEVTLSQVDSAETTEIVAAASTYKEPTTREMLTSASTDQEPTTTEMLTAASPDQELTSILPARVTKYYHVFLPKTSEGYMLSISNLNDPKVREKITFSYDLGYSTFFVGYRLHQNGDKSIAEQNHVIRNYGDIITAVNDIDVDRLSFENVQTLLTEALPDSNNMVKLTLMDITLLNPKPHAVNQLEGTQPQSSHRNVGGKNLFMVGSNEEDSCDNVTLLNLTRGITSVDGCSELVDTDEEVDQSRIHGISHHLQRLKLDSNVTCGGCQRKLRGKHIIVALDAAGEVQTYCYRCSRSKRPFDKAMMDHKLLKTFGTSPKVTYGISNDTNFSPAEKKSRHQINMHNRKLAAIDEILYFTRGGVERYRGRPKDDEDNAIYIFHDLINETLFQFFRSEFRKIKLRKNIWHELSPAVKEYIRLHGLCYSDDRLYYCLFETESVEWRYIRYNTWDKSDVILGESYKIIDTREEASQENTAWLSFTNDTKCAEIQMVPCYYLKRWELFCERDKLPGTPNEYANVMMEAKDCANRWVEIPQGSSKRNFFAFESGNFHHLPKSYRLQPFGENSCVFNSLANALHYINDYRGREEILARLDNSLDYSEYREVAKTRRAFAAYVMNYCVKGYIAKVLTNLDVLNDRTMWPTLCILKGDDNSTNHAVTIVENFVFDSNNTYALPLDKSTLDWCCSGDSQTKVKFVSVPFAYRFYKHNPPPQLVLRNGRKNILAVQAVIRSLLEINDTLAVSMLEEYKISVTPDANVLSGVREKLKTKTLQYVPLRIKDINDLLLQTSDNFPTMFLAHLRGTFHYAIFSSVGNQYFDGTRGESIILTPENLITSLDHNGEVEYMTSTTSSLELLKGYVFTKKEKTSVIRKRRKVGGSRKSKKISH